MIQAIDPRLRHSYRPAPKAGDYVLYWMQAAQRLSYNPALCQAAALALDLHLPLLVAFCVTDDVPDANLRHYAFMIEGVYDVAQQLASHGVSLVLGRGDTISNLQLLTARAAALVSDYGYLRWQRELRNQMRSHCRSLGITYLEYETESVVPVELASPKEEYSAATLRRKLLQQVDSFLIPQPDFTASGLSRLPAKLLDDLDKQGFKDATSFRDASQMQQWSLSGLDIDRSLGPSPHIKGGEEMARQKLNKFLNLSLASYATRHSDPSKNYQSGLSPYLHFGQISPVEISLQVLGYGATTDWKAADLILHKAELTDLLASKAAFLEELIVRRELSFNFCYYNPDYDSYRAISAWARTSLELHLADPRTHNYSIDILESAQTLDPYWNAAQKELIVTGKMHNYMRMYWGKKLIEWSPDPELAYYQMLYLNNRYSLDGRDPNSYAGIAWCFGQHDRPWKERPIFGKVRYMNAKGLERKFDMQTYLDYTDALLKDNGD